jgi:pimeloyl-ACP methyl ester carboxylesterase
VWEDRAARRGRKVPLEIVLLPATGARPAKDPVLYFAGGPGDAATGAASFLAEQLAAVRERRAVLLVDQRGSRTSNPLMCPLGGTDDDLQSYLGEQFPLAEVRRCRAELDKRADLRLYTTTLAVDDFAEVVAWLGYERVNLFGASGGTRTAQVFIRRHPALVRSAVLLGVVPIDETLPIGHAAAGQRALDLLFDACAADPACAAAFPRLEEEFAAVLARLEKAPAVAEVEHPETGKPVTVRVSREVFAEGVRFFTYGAESARRVPLVVHDAARGDFSPIAEIALGNRRGLLRQLAIGLLLSVTCAEDLPFIDPATIPERTRGSYLGDDRVRQQLRACGEWPRGALPPGHRELVRTETPVLMLVGEMDPVTPPAFAARVAAGMPKSLQVVVPGGGHDVFAPCTTGLMAEFLERGSSHGLDTACVAAVPQPPFATPAATAPERQGRR